MATKKSVFERAEKALTNGTSEQCKSLIRELNDLAAQELPDLEASAPPDQVPAWDGQGRIHGYQTSEAGPRYRQAALSDDPAELQTVMAEHARLAERRAECERLRYALEKRAKQAGEQALIEAAPEKAREIVESIDGAMDELAAVMEQYKSIRQRLQDLVSDLARQRDLSDECPALSVEQFSRAGVQLAHRLQRAQQELYDVTGGRGAYIVEPLFGEHKLSLQMERRLLPGPPDGLLARLRRRTRSILSVNPTREPREPTPHEQREAETVWRRERLALIERGEIEAATRLQTGDLEKAS